MSQAAPPRVTLSLLAALHAAVFLALGLTLVGLWPWFSGMTSLVGLTHGTLAICVAARRTAWRLAWRVAAFASLTWLFGLGAALASAGVYLVEIYGTLGRTVAALFVIAWLLGALFALPLSAWGLAATGGLRGRRREALVAGSAALAIAIAASLGTLGAGWTKVAPLEHADIDKTLEGRLVPGHEPTKRRARLSLEPVVCPHPIDATRVSLFVHSAGHQGKKRAAVSRCVQGSDLAAAAAAAARWLDRNRRRARTQIDIVTRFGSLARRDPLLGALSLRGGIDGVCARARCLSSWQLVARGLVQERAPIPGLPEVRFGFSPARLRAALGVDASEPLRRVEISSFALEDSLVPLARQRRARVTVEPAALRRAQAAAERHIVRAQRRDGSFRYALDPIGGRSVEGENLVRQAGTTLVLCELGGKKGRRAARRALRYFRRLERRSGRGSVLAKRDASTTSLGSVALPLVALLSCRGVLGHEFDPLIVRMLRVLLALERDDGSFHPLWSIKEARPLDGPPPLFAPGQAVMALLLAERARGEKSASALPGKLALRAAAARSMDYFGARYWDHPLAEAFYLEENWHCLAARVAISVHRHDAYENFCLDYARFKGRFLLEGHDVPVELRGAYAATALVPPPNTATAGVGEVLAAALEVARARGADARVERARLQSVLEFLLRQQWDATACAVCKDPRLVVGGFSDSMLRPELRIDFTQHAWAAIGHGARALGLLEQGS